MRRKNTDPKYSVHIDMGESVHQGDYQQNPASQEEINKFVEDLDEVTLYASSAYGRRPSVKDWESGKDFKAIAPQRWVGGPYFSIRDAQRIYDLGYRKIIVGGHEGFDIDLVQQ